MEKSKERVWKAFEAYLSVYDLSDPKIHLKEVHTFWVARNSEIIARSLGLEEADVLLAWKIGMLHDIGRFEQLRIYHTFDDSNSIDHAEFGADLLFSEGLIRNFEEDTEHYELMEKAVRYHNRYRLPKDLTERETMFCQIIRDADKIDIFRANYETGLEQVYSVSAEEIQNSEITESVYQVFLQEQAIPRELHRTIADRVTGHLALTFELVYPISVQMTVKQGYLWKLLEIEFQNFDTAQKMEEMKVHLQQWCKEKI